MMKNISLQDSVKTGKWIIQLLVPIGIVSIVVGLFSLHDMLFQSVAVLLSVMVTAIVTGALLERQTKGEEKREMNIKIYENKISVYAQFISRMWDLVADDNRPIKTEQLIALRTEFFNKLIFYIDATLIEKISEQFEKLANIEYDEKKNNVEYRTVFAAITSVLYNDITPKDADTGKADQHEEYTKTVKRLWASFGSTEEDNTSAGPTVQGRDQRIDRCVHFSMLDAAYQKNLYDGRKNTNHLVPLFLCEYGESWRTNFIKERIRANDIVFLFQRGGIGYVGAFLAKGYVVFEADEETRDISCEIYDYDTETIQKVDKSNVSKIKELMLLYQAGDLPNDEGATYYSYLLAEPVILYKDMHTGIGSVSTYRRTISSYDPHYAGITFARFMGIAQNGSSDLYVNTELLNRIAAENDLAPAKPAENGTWID